MKKKPTTSQYIDGIFGVLILGVILLFLVSCTSTTVLPGLCYNDRDGTHICPKDYEEEESERDLEEFEPIYEYCEPWEFDSEAWMNCIMNEEQRRNLIRRLA